MLMIQALWYLHPHHLSSALAKSIILIMFILLPSIMWIFKAWLRWSSRHWPPSSSRLKMIAGFMEFLLLLVTRLSLFAAWSFARQWIMKPFRLLIKWSVQLDLTQIPINSLAGELQKRPRILIVSAEFLTSIEVVPCYRSTRNLSIQILRFEMSCSTWVWLMVTSARLCVSTHVRFFSRKLHRSKASPLL